MTGSETVGTNPYVGPRPFEVGETLYGRGREVKELEYRLSAERIVLLHSPSGAGKSSLIHAGLIPQMRERFDVWRPTRVGHPLPTGVPTETNRHVLSAMLGLEQGIPEAMRRSAAELAGMRLAAYVEGRARRPGAPESVLLIVDQFEEILTIDPLALAAKQEFFVQLGEALQNPNVWALFSLREDYLAPLDPYAQLVPTHLINRYRIDLLGLETASEAVVEPSMAAGRTWGPCAAVRLIRDLATAKLQQADGTFIEQFGHHVEPMHLQVVCHELWDRMPADDLVIDVAQVEAFGDVTDALAGYYAAAVRRIAADDERSERAVRAWVGETLFTADGVRTPVLRAARESEGLANPLIERLVDAHLVRSEHRGGAVWYELAHDRLVKPVREDNARWEQAHLRPMQVQAALWARQGKPAGLLLSDEALALAERWVGVQPVPLAEPDHSFLAASRAARAQERTLRAAQRRFVAAVASLGVLAVLAAVVSLWQWREAAEAKASAEEQAGRARDQTRLVTAIAALQHDPTSQVVLLREIERPAGMHLWWQWAFELRTRPIAQVILPHDGPGVSAVLSPDGRRVVSASEDGTASVAGLDGQAAPVVLRGFKDQVGSPLPFHTVPPPAFSPDGHRVLIVTKDRTARVWRADSGGEPITHQVHGGYLMSAAFSPDGGQVLTLSDDGAARVWGADGQGEAVELQRHKAAIRTAVFSPEGRRVLTGAEDGAARVWQANGQGEPVVLRHEGAVDLAVFSPGGGQVLTVSGGVGWVWATDGKGEPIVLRDPDGSVQSAVFSPEGSRVLTLSNVGPRVWRTDVQGEPVVFPMDKPFDMSPVPFHRGQWSPDGSRILIYLREGAAWLWQADGQGMPIDLAASGVNAATFSPDGSRILIASADGLPKLLRVDGHEEPTLLRGHAHGVRWGQFSRDGGRMLTVSEDNTARVWRVDSEDKPTFVVGSGVESLQFSPDGRRVLVASRDGTAQVWPADGPGEPIVLRGHARELTTARFSRDGSRVLTASRDGTARVWWADGRSEPVVLQARVPPPLPPPPPASLPPGMMAFQDCPDCSAEFSSDGRRVLISSMFGLRVWSADGQGEPVDLPQQVREHWAVFSPDGRGVLTASDDGTARLRPIDGQAERIFRGHEGPVFRAVFSPDGSWVLTASEDGTARLWPVDGQGEPIVLAMLGIPIDSAVFSPDGSRVMTASTRDDKVRVWPVDGQGEPVVLAGAARSRTIDFSPDGGWIKTVEPEKAMVELWRSNGGGRPVVLQDVVAAAFSPDGTRMATASAGGAVRIRSWQVDALLSDLWRATPYCLPVPRRVELLGESEDYAGKQLADCEARVAGYAAQGAYQ